MLNRTEGKISGSEHHADPRCERLSTHCPFKGDASYWTIEAGGRTHDAIAWSYEQPKEGAEEIAGHLAFFSDRAEISVDGDWCWSGRSTILASLQAPGLVGDFQIENAAAVLALLEAAGLLSGIDHQLVNQILPKLSLPGRAQRLISMQREWLIDVAHNPAAAEALATTLASEGSTCKTTAIVGLLDDKDVAGVIGPIAEYIDQWVAMPAESHRAVAVDELARQISNLSGKACYVADSAQAAIDFSRRNSSENDRILVTGSFFTVGPVLPQLAKKTRSN